MGLVEVETAIQVLHFIEEQSEPDLSVPLPVPSACAGGHETSDRLHSAAVIAQWQRRAFDEDFAGRTLPFGAGTVPAYVGIVSEGQSIGRPISQFDAQIAATARHAGAKLATRNTTDFEKCGVALIDPWTGSVT